MTRRIRSGGNAGPRAYTSNVSTNLLRVYTQKAVPAGRSIFEVKILS